MVGQSDAAWFLGEQCRQYRLAGGDLEYEAWRRLTARILGG